MSKEFFIRIAGEEQGPVTDRELRNLVAAGVLTQRDEVRVGRLTRWRRASDLQGLWPIAELQEMNSQREQRSEAFSPEVSGDPPPLPAVSAERELEWLAFARIAVPFVLAFYLAAIQIPVLLLLCIPTQAAVQLIMMRSLNWTLGTKCWTIIGGLVPYLGCLSLVVTSDAAKQVLTDAGYEVGVLTVKEPLSKQLRDAAHQVGDHGPVGVLIILWVIGLWIWCLALGLLLIAYAREYFAQQQRPGAGLQWPPLLFVMAKSVELAAKESISLQGRLSR